MARSKRIVTRRLAGAIVLALSVPAVVACNGIIGLSDFEKTECSGRRCGDGSVNPDVVTTDAADGGTDASPDVRGTSPVSWAQWPMPNSDGGADFLPNPMKYNAVGSDNVEDTVTGLVWKKATMPNRMTIDAAINACATLEATTSWRLPKRIELVTLLDFASTTNFLIAPIFTGVKNVQVWTSSEYRKYVGNSVEITDAFWTVDFGNGVVKELSSAGGAEASVLCVKAK